MNKIIDISALKRLATAILRTAIDDGDADFFHTERADELCGMANVNRSAILRHLKNKPVKAKNNRGKPKVKGEKAGPDEIDAEGVGNVGKKSFSDNSEDFLSTIVGAKNGTHKIADQGGQVGEKLRKITQPQGAVDLIPGKKEVLPWVRKRKGSRHP